MLIDKSLANQTTDLLWYTESESEENISLAWKVRQNYYLKIISSKYEQYTR